MCLDIHIYEWQGVHPDVSLRILTNAVPGGIDGEQELLDAFFCVSYWLALRQ